MCCCQSLSIVVYLVTDKTLLCRTLRVEHVFSLFIFIPCQLGLSDVCCASVAQILHVLFHIAIK